MDRFRQLETFVAVAQMGGFNAAARQLHMSPPSVTRLVAALEERTGTRLFTRTTRQVALTEAGARLFEDAKRILADVEDAEASAAGAHVAPQGVLSVTGPVKFGQIYVAPILRDFLDLHPAVSAQVLFVDRVVDLIDEGLDVAVRIGNLPDSSLTAVRVGYVRRVVVAAPSYLKKHGPLETPEALKDHRIATSVDLNPGPEWVFANESVSKSVAVTSTLRGNTVDTALDAVISGWGITRAMSYQVADAIESGELVEVLRDHEDRKVPIHLVHAEGTLRSAKIRAFVDFARDRLKQKAPRWSA